MTTSYVFLVFLVDSLLGFFFVGAAGSSLLVFEELPLLSFFVGSSFPEDSPFLFFRFEPSFEDDPFFDEDFLDEDEPSFDEDFFVEDVFFEEDLFFFLS